MNPAKRIIVNTTAQYTKAIINICLSLYSTRLVLEALDVRDYGIYSVVAGIIGILGYLTNSLVVTTQRYLSYYYGSGDSIYVKKVFANSMLIHIIISIVFCILFLSLKPFLIDSFLNIDHERIVAAGYVYIITVGMLMITLITTPFKALLIARENIVYISAIEIFDGILKLALAITLMAIGLDKLIFYSIGIFVVLAVNFTLYAAYCMIKYEESHITFKNNPFDKKCMRQIIGFAGWTTFGMLAGMCQTQGTAIVLNKFFGTVMNAAFGIASQVNGAVRFVSTSVLNAMNPQIMKAEGAGDRQSMLRLAGKESKFSTALMMIISIPIIAEAPAILAFWLKEVPPHTVLFCRALMIAFIVDQLTLGLHAANQATGKIRCYSILTTVPKIMIIPVMWIVFTNDYPVSIAMYCYVGIELLVSLFRIPYMKISAGLNVHYYIKTVILPLAPLCIIMCLASMTLMKVMNFNFSFVVSSICSAIIGVITMWMTTLDQKEREFARNIIKSHLPNGNRHK